MTQTIAARLARSLLVLSCLAAAQAASAKLDPATERRYGGVYSNACTEPAALRVRFYEDTMAVERAGKSVVANRVRVQKGARDGASTPDFQGTATGEVRGGDGLAFALHHNADGLFATIEGGAKSLAALGPGVQGQRLRHCDPNRNALPGAPVPVVQGPPDLLRDARFRSAYSKALGPLFREPWLARMDGPAPPLRQLVIDGVEYTLGSVCKPHDCAEHNMVVLYSPQQGSVYALVQRRGRMQAFGNPPGATAKEMEKLWATEWRANGDREAVGEGMTNESVSRDEARGDEASSNEARRAVVLLSGGLDSTTVLAIARGRGFEPCALSFRYGQRHAIELDSARRVARAFGVTNHVVAEIDLKVFGGSSLTGDAEVPKDRPASEMSGEIPSTYVPARNTIFLSFALAYAEVLGASDIFIGVNAIDYSGYPDCRPEYIDAFERMANLATKAGVEGSSRLRIHAPLSRMSKAEIIQTGLQLGVDYSMTSSCYDPGDDGRPCGRCDSCRLRAKGFAEAGLEDPLLVRFGAA